MEFLVGGQCFFLNRGPQFIGIFSAKLSVSAKTKVYFNILVYPPLLIPYCRKVHAEAIPRRRNV